MPPPVLRLMLFLFVGITCSFYSSPILAQDELLPSEHGYLLIRVKLSSRERVRTLAMSNVDTDHVVSMNTDSFEKVGLNSWMALVAIPSGRYFWSEYEPIIGNDAAESQITSRRHRRSAPGSAGDTFEIVPGVVNYIGNWKMRTVSSQRNRLDPVIEYDNATLQEYVSRYPERSIRYETYLSVMGKAAISLAELAKIIEEQSESR